MNREIYISGERAVIPTEFYLHLVSCENNNSKLIKYLESMLDGSINDKFVVISVIDLLERVKSGNYE